MKIVQALTELKYLIYVFTHSHGMTLVIQSQAIPGYFSNRILSSISHGFSRRSNLFYQSILARDQNLKMWSHQRNCLVALNE
jgi:hypothetical protein